jgi:hypothetical protein
MCPEGTKNRDSDAIFENGDPLMRRIMLPLAELDDFDMRHPISFIILTRFFAAKTVFQRRSALFDLEPKNVNPHRLVGQGRRMTV